MFDSSDGLVVHTGQYFVCADSCDRTPTIWQLQITAPNKNVVNRQGVYISTASWQDDYDGSTFYVGPRLPNETESLRSIVDPGLPSQLKTMLTVELPRLIELLGKYFKALPSKPLVFATYNEGAPELSGFQGGVLNKTVNLHWWGVALDQRVRESDELWFIIHEIAHFYQSQESEVDVDEDAWIHEGFAELMAAMILTETDKAFEAYVQQRFNRAKAECERGLVVTSIGKATQMKQFDLHYTCGLLLHRFISQHSTEKLTVFDLWNRYRAAINQGKEPSRKTYLEVAKQILSEEDYSVLRSITGLNLPSGVVIDQFFANSTF